MCGWIHFTLILPEFVCVCVCVFVCVCVCVCVCVFNEILLMICLEVKQVHGIQYILNIKYI